MDPLSAIERIRGAFRVAGRVGSFMIPVYDGARRFDIVGRILPKQISSDGVLRAELTLRAIAGIKGETSEDGDPDDAPRKVELSVDEARMVPLSITVPVFSLPLVVQFQRLWQRPTLVPDEGPRGTEVSLLRSGRRLSSALAEMRKRRPRRTGPRCGFEMRRGFRPGNPLAISRWTPTTAR